MRSVSVAGLAWAGMLLAATPGWGQERPIKRADLPPAVDSAVAVESRGATIRGFAEEREHGRKYYEAELLVRGHHKDVLLDSTGTVVEIEKEVPLDSLPAAAKAALTSLARPGRIAKVETLTKRGRLVAYEAQVVSAGKRREIQVGPDGKPLAHPE
ncbi:MAG TPA: hypothetical protein VK672_08290 [Solirubrobacteraceae bacterium]|nr:hypothetical protein [Solirubrobacteraceae bacterium]